MSPLTDALWVRYRKNGDPAARAELLDGYLGLVHHCAREIARRAAFDLELDELVSAGTIGLVQALEGFDETRGLAFSTYAMPRIRGAMLDELRRRDWMPRTVRGRSRRMAEARVQIQQRTGRSAGEQEMAQALGVDLETLWKWTSDAEPRVMLALDDPVESGDGEARLAEIIPDLEAPGPEDAIGEAQALDRLRAAFDALPQRERLVLTLYYYEEMNMREIGEVLHVTESRISQIRTLALRRLKDECGLVAEDL